MQQTTVPAGMLTILGAVFAVLGFFAGAIAWTALGLGAIAFAGVIALFADRSRRA